MVKMYKLKGNHFGRLLINKSNNNTINNNNKLEPKNEIPISSLGPKYLIIKRTYLKKDLNLLSLQINFGYAKVNIEIYVSRHLNVIEQDAIEQTTRLQDVHIKKCVNNVDSLNMKKKLNVKKNVFL